MRFDLLDPFSWMAGPPSLPLRVLYRITLNNLKRNLCVSEDLPESYAAVFHSCFPRNRQTPGFGLLSFECATGETEQGEAINPFNGVSDLDGVIREPIEVAAPAGSHLRFTANLVAMGRQ